MGNVSQRVKRIEDISEKILNYLNDQSLDSEKTKEAAKILVKMICVVKLFTNFLNCKG